MTHNIYETSNNKIFRQTERERGENSLIKLISPSPFSIESEAKLFLSLKKFVTKFTNQISCQSFPESLAQEPG